ncbi:MAG: MopE-related protein [Candidatus Pacearchaeota archaeon]|nr:MopE-related protein [Candidatus Pacearchaeota archaeon]
MKKRIFSLFLISTVLLFSLASVSAEKIVLFAMDDFQVWWLENIQESIVQIHINNNIPVTLGVIPEGITDPWGAGDRIIERIKRWDSYSFIEVAQHGYDHIPEFAGMSYSSQYADIKKGNDLMKSIGISPASFIPPFGSADLNTINVLIALGFHTLYNPVEMSPTSSNNLLIIQDQLILCRDGDEGKDCVYKDYNTIKSEIDQKIQTDGVALVLYHMQDFDTGNGNVNTNKANQIVNYANQLKQDGYTLMTVEQYYQHLKSPGLIDNDKDGYDSTKDCNDNNKDVWQFLNGYLDNDKDGYGTGSLLQVCSGINLPAGYSSNNLDCNDNNLAIHPGAVETACNGIDNDCDLAIDEDYLIVASNCGIGQCASTGLLQCLLGKEVNFCVPNLPTAEVCDGKDNDCDGQTDEGVKITYYKDADADGYGNPSITIQACSAPAGYVTDKTDCNDNNLAIHPNAIEVCNNQVDDNCNGLKDEGCAAVCGNSICEASETCSSCSLDCGVCPPVCGNGVCESANGETCSSCSSDCGVCSIKTMIIRPNGYGYRTGWTNVNCPSGYNEWQCVSDTTLNINDYLKDSGTAKETFTFSNTGLTNAKINSVTLYFYAMRNLYSYNSCFEAMIRYGNRDYLSGSQLCLGSSWQYVSYIYNKNPATNLPWTISQVEALEAGMHSLDPNGGGRIAQVYAVVEYV